MQQTENIKAASVLVSDVCLGGLDAAVEKPRQAKNLVRALGERLKPTRMNSSACHPGIVRGAGVRRFESDTSSQENLAGSRITTCGGFRDNKALLTTLVSYNWDYLPLAIPTVRCDINLCPYYDWKSWTVGHEFDGRVIHRTVHSMCSHVGVTPTPPTHLTVWVSANPVSHLTESGYAGSIPATHILKGCVICVVR